MPSRKQTQTRTRSTARRKSTRRASSGNGRAREGIGRLEQPMSPMPPQHQRKPGIEAKLEPRPRYEAPLYAGAGKLKKKVALITGGDSGIGRAVAVLFAREGADVAFTYLKEEESDARETKEAIEREGRPGLMMTMEARDSDSCQKAVETTINNFEIGRAHV